MTKGELYSAVKLMSQRPRLSDTDLDVYLGTTDTELNTMLISHPRNGVVAEYSTTADPDTGEYSNLVPIPTDMAELVVLQQDGTVYPQCPPGKPFNGPGFISRGKCFEVQPDITADTTFTIHYRAFLTPLVNPWDSNWVSTYFSGVYLYGMLKELGAAVVHDRRGEWAQEFVRLTLDLRKQGWNQNVASSPRSRSYG